MQRRKYPTETHVLALKLNIQEEKKKAFGAFQESWRDAENKQKLNTNEQTLI